jgi:tight adherence protein B
VMVFTVMDMRKKRPHSRIKARAQDVVNDPSEQVKIPQDSYDENLFQVGGAGNALVRWFRGKTSVLRTVAGANGYRLVAGAAVAGLLLALAMSRFMPLPSFAPPLLILGLPPYALMRMYNFLVGRFRKRFLEGFPDVIDLIVRAVRAGVPATHAIGSVPGECAEPLRHEFQLMADSLQVGQDLEEVLTVAMRRIQIADFSFFCVCVLLQRETGGQLGETLENLAGIVRTRREIRQKSKALTGEARITTKILAAIPVIITAGMYATNRGFFMILFETPAGQKLLTFGAISVVIGIMVINKMATLDTSR